MREKVTQQEYPNEGSGAIVLPLTLAFTAWQKVNNPKGVSNSCSWLVFCERLNPKNVKACAHKGDLPGWAPALFKEDKRSLKNCAQVSALVWDYEKGATTPQEAKAFFRSFGMGALHTSYSHNPEAPRFRVILPLSRLATPQEHTRLWAWMFKHIQKAGHKIDIACKDPSRLWYAPGYPQEAAELYEARVWDGSPLDVDTLLAELPKEAPQEAPKVPPKACKVASSTPRAPRISKEALDTVERARLYLQKMDGAISGQGGHNATYRAACAMVLGFDLDTETALSLLLSEFNPRCSPQWSEKELRHKVESANKEGGPRGHLLEVKKERPLSPVVTRPKEKTLDEELQSFTRLEAAVHIQNAVYHSISLKNQIGVVVVPYAGGKSDAVRRLVASWSTLREELEPFPIPLALLTTSHKLAIESTQLAELLGIDTARYFSPPGRGGPRLDPPPGTPKGRPGPLVCIKPRPTVEGHSAAGVPGHRQCVGCPKFDTCKAAPGRLGAQNALLQIGVQHSPTLPLENAKGLVVDEWPEIIQNHSLTIVGLKALAKGCPSLLLETRRVLQAAAKSVLSWLERKAPQDEDPLASHREAIKALAIQDDGNTRVELARDPDYRPNRPLEDKGALLFIDSWKTGKALISAVLEKGTLYRCGDGSVAWYGLTRIAKALKEVEGAVILTATPGDIAELEKATGKKAVVIVIPIRPIAPIQNVLKYNTSSTRSGYFDSHGRPRWQKPPAKEGQKPRKAPLVQDLEDLTAWLRERPTIRSLLLGTYRTVALALRLLWVKFRAIEANPEDTNAWNQLHAGNVEKAVGKARQARSALDALFTLLQEREITLDVIWYHAENGLNEWREEGREFDACVSLGDAFPPLDEHRRRYADARDIDLSALAEDDQDWQAAYDASAAAQEGQLHGRLGDVGRPADRPAWHLHIGSTIPAGWQQTPITELPRRPKHRPKHQAPPEAEGWQEALSAAVEEQGSVAALAILWGVKPGTLRHSTREGRTPSAAILAKLQTWLEERARGGREARPESPINTIGETAIGLSGRLETNPPESPPTEAEAGEPAAPWLAPTPLAPDRGICLSSGEAEEEKAREARAEILEACFGVSPWSRLARELCPPRLESLGDSVAGLNLTPEDLEPSLSLEGAEELAAYLEVYRGTPREEAEEKTLAAYARLVRAAPVWALCDAH